MSFRYAELGKDEFRLLEPLQGTDPTKSRFNVIHRRREPGIPYTAVSYTWGDEKATEVIELDGKEAYIRPNLWSCLYCLNNLTTPRTWQYVSADAIYINQTDILERNFQVTTMAEVYRRALVVNVWLGLEPQDVTLSPSMGVTDGIDSKRGFQWEDAIPDLINRPYWTRIWVIQEFLLAMRLEILCGRNQISLLDFEHLIRKYLSNIGDGNLLMAPLVQACAPAPMILERRLHSFSLESLHKLVELISRQQHSSCKDPRDRVFALLNLVFEEERDILT